jgi:hypothetical protein
VVCTGSVLTGLAGHGGRHGVRRSISSGSRGVDSLGVKFPLGGSQNTADLLLSIRKIGLARRDAFFTRI